jgi:small nuclear ribonucleoprotein (snRNP)-like protein
MIITQQEYLDWVEHPVTKALKKSLHNDREYLKEMIVRGNVDNEEEVKGRCNAVLNILNITYEDLVEGAREDAKY